MRCMETNNINSEDKCVFFDDLPENLIAAKSVGWITVLINKNKYMDNSIDLVTNVDSFQEMTQEQIQNYFKLTQRVCRNSGFFFSSNRVEKIPYGENPFTVEQPDLPNKSAEFPWNLKNKDLVNEISSLERLVQLDATSIRLQQIVK